MINKLNKVTKKARLGALYILDSKISRVIPDGMFLKFKYQIKMNRKLNLENPQTFNEKIQWLKLYNREPLYTSLVDKFEVRKHIANIIGKEYLIPILGSYKSYNEINFDDLPNEFVLKPNHTSGNVFICNDKSKIDHSELKKIINKWLKRKYYWLHREWPYKNIEPRIICEKYMVEDFGGELKDYKIMCFNGKAKCLFVGLNRNSLNGLNVDFYDLDWNPLPFERYYPNSGTTISKPINFEKMLKFAEKLSTNMIFVRVDFYETNGQLYFGELTFHPGSGFEAFNPESYDYLLGSWMKISKKSLISNE